MLQWTMGLLQQSGVVGGGNQLISVFIDQNEGMRSIDRLIAKDLPSNEWLLHEV